MCRRRKPSASEYLSHSVVSTSNKSVSHVTPCVWGQLLKGNTPTRTFEKPGRQRAILPTPTLFCGLPDASTWSPAPWGTYMCAVTAPTNTDHVLFLDREDLFCQFQADITRASRPLAEQRGHAGSGLWGKAETQAEAVSTGPRPACPQPRNTHPDGPCGDGTAASIWPWLLNTQ